MRVSKFIKAEKDILIEYIYDDGNNISDSYKILHNFKDNSYSYVSGSASTTGNTPGNQLFKIDGVNNNYGKLDTSTYTFLQLKDYASGSPIRHDIIKIHLPINYTFGENIGCYIRAYTFDYNNKITYDISNFFFDATDVNQSYLLNYNSPPLLFQEKLWGKNITINIPSIYTISNQRVNNATKNNSINFNLTNGTGLSQNTPLFIDFHFITTKKTINNISTYYLTSKTSMSLPQSPDFENIGVKIEHSKNGDYFEIYGIFNDNSSEFASFIKNSIQLGNRYYVTYTITLYEQNIRGKTFTITVTDNFSDKIEYRPIIKYSTTTAIIDVEMNVIDAVDNSSIFRRASYGMLQDEVAKYSVNLTKINISNASKPKIYNIKSPEGAGIFGNSNNGLFGNKSQIVLDPIKVNYTVLADKFNIVAKSENVSLGKLNFYGIGKLQIIIQPFDNVIQFKIAQDVSGDKLAVDSGNGSQLQYSSAPEYLDMTNMGEIKMVIKNQQLSVEFGLYMSSNNIDLSIGSVAFKIPAGKINDIRKIYDSGINVFYITSKNDSGTFVIYSGLFLIYDSKSNVNILNTTAAQIQSNLGNDQTPSIITDPNSTQKGTAVVTRRITTSNSNSSSITNTSSATSVSSSTKIENVVYQIDESSSLSINGLKYTSSNIKEALGLNSVPINLSFKTDSLYSNNQLLDNLKSLSDKLYKKFVITKDQKDISKDIQSSFINDNNSISKNNSI